MAFVLSGNTLTIFHENQVHTLDSTHPKWETVLQAVKDGDLNTAVQLANTKQAIDALIEGTSIRIENSQVLYQDQPVHSTFADYLMRMYAEGFAIEPLARCLERLMRNPSYRAREQFGAFLEANRLPITDDGCFMAYKRVSEEFKDLHTNSISNQIGTVVSMPRSEVDDDPTRTCSAGLHVCGLEYLKEFYGEKLVACKVSPEHVVSVPVDYNNSKMRVCQYEVVAELPIGLVKSDRHDEWDTPVYESAEIEEDDEDDAYCCDDDDGYPD